MTITYTTKDGVYINLTNRCSNSCGFCIRNNSDGVYGSGSLWLEREPEAREVIEDLKKYDLSVYGEVVFCGYGEPTERLDTLLEVAAFVKGNYKIPVRINTNGHGSLINGYDITPRLKGLVDVVSVSLNTANAKDYVKLCKPEFGEEAYDGLIDFARKCVPCVKTVVLSVVDTTLSAEDVETCRKIAEDVGAVLKIRPFEN